jgi:hypothetical protein
MAAPAELLSALMGVWFAATGLGGSSSELCCCSCAGPPRLIVLCGARYLAGELGALYSAMGKAQFFIVVSGTRRMGYSVLSPEPVLPRDWDCQRGLDGGAGAMYQRDARAQVGPHPNLTTLWPALAHSSHGRLEGPRPDGFVATPGEAGAAHIELEETALPAAH